MENNIITGLDLMLFMSHDMIKIDIHQGELQIIVSEDLAEQMTAQSGIQISTDFLKEMVKTFMELASSANFTIEEYE